MAQLLETGKIDSARIRVENIIRSDITTELHEILELYCELLLALAGLLDAPTCDPGLEEAVKKLVSGETLEKFPGSGITITDVGPPNLILLDVSISKHLSRLITDASVQTELFLILDPPS